MLVGILWPFPVISLQVFLLADVPRVTSPTGGIATCSATRKPRSSALSAGLSVTTVTPNRELTHSLKIVNMVNSQFHPIRKCPHVALHTEMWKSVRQSVTDVSSLAPPSVQFFLMIFMHFATKNMQNNRLPSSGKFWIRHCVCFHVKFTTFCSHVAFCRWNWCHKNICSLRLKSY